MTLGASNWQRAWDAAQPRLDAFRDAVSQTASPSTRVLRVGQLDADLLDQELVNILKEPVEKALSLLNVSKCFYTLMLCS
jgi:peroxin-2